MYDVRQQEKRLYFIKITSNFLLIINHISNQLFREFILPLFIIDHRHILPNQIIQVRLHLTIYPRQSRIQGIQCLFIITCRIIQTCQIVVIVHQFTLISRCRIESDSRIVVEFCFIVKSLLEIDITYIIQRPPVAILSVGYLTQPQNIKIQIHGTVPQSHLFVNSPHGCLQPHQIRILLIALYLGEIGFRRTKKAGHCHMLPSEYQTLSQRMHHAE